LHYSEKKYKKRVILMILYELYMRNKYWENINKNKTYFVD